MRKQHSHKCYRFRSSFQRETQSIHVHVSCLLRLALHNVLVIIYSIFNHLYYAGPLSRILGCNLHQYSFLIALEMYLLVVLL